MDPSEDIVDELLARCRNDFLQWINGDGRGYELPEDGTILGPFGGQAIRGGPGLAAMQRDFAQKVWLSGTGDVELITGGASGDIAWLVYIERAMVSFPGYDRPRRWELRITDLFRRKENGWERFHIHEDACVDPRDLDAVLGQLRP